MLEHLINDESDKARELFHQIVVAKSREIYEQILAEDFNDVDTENKDEDNVNEDEDEDEDEDMDESFGFAEGEDDESGDDVGGDASDDMIDDLESDDMNDEDDMGSEDDLEDRVVDLEDALDELKAEFESLMSDENGMENDEMDMNDDEMDMDMDSEKDELSFETDNFMREYVEKVGGKDYTSYGKMGDNGVNTRSIVAGKNDMGGTVANLKGGTESSPVEANKGHLKGSSLLKANPKEQNMGNLNVPGGNAGKTAFKHKQPTYPNGLGKEQADKSADSILNGVSKRAK
jgi:hypothetical protein